MKEFNYKKAWQKLASPGWETLPDDVKRLVYITCCALPYGQEKNFDMAWPVDKIDSEGLTFGANCVTEKVTGAKCCADLATAAVGLKVMFERIDSVTLVRAARIVHEYGHWAPGVRKQPLLEDAPWVTKYMAANAVQQVGGHWKFSNLCDQILTARLGMVRARTARSPRGVSYVVLEGTLRAQCNTEGSWTWREIGWATPENWAKVSAVPRPSLLDTNRTPARIDELFGEYVAKVKAVTTDDGFAELTNTEPFMEEGLPRGAL